MNLEWTRDEFFALTSKLPMGSLIDRIQDSSRCGWFYMGFPIIFIPRLDKYVAFIECRYCGSHSAKYEYNLLGEPCCSKCGGLL